MADCKVLPLRERSNEHWELFLETLQQEENFSNFTEYYRRIFKKQFLIHKRHFKVQRVVLETSEKIKIASLLFIPQNGWGGPCGMGCFAISPDVTKEDVSLFWNFVRKEFSALKLVAPFLGHLYLEFSIPEHGSDPKKIGFMTTTKNKRIDFLLAGMNIYRKYHSLETELTNDLVARLKFEIKQIPANFRIREFHHLHAKKDLAKMNQLVNQCFRDHFDFCPLTDEENWDVMKWGVPIIKQGTFLFLMDGSREIGFAFGMMDYNQILSGRSDLMNLGRVFLKGRHVNRARLIHIGLLKEYRGQRLNKFLRHQLLLNFYKLGVRTVESSYIDQGNEASFGNVQSTGAQLLHTFATLIIS